MRVIITGGTGLIGRALSENLVADGHEVIVLSRSPQKAKGVSSGVQLERWDAITSAGWGKLVDGADAIVNLAGAGIADARWSPKRKELLESSRIHAGRAVIEAIEQAEQKPKALIQASAVGYYGASLEDTVFTEESSPGSDFLARLCFEWETSTAKAETLGVRRTVIRTGIVLSNEGGAWPKIKLPFTIFAGGPLGSGKQWSPWIHIEDEVRAIRYLIENQQASGNYNLTAPAPVTNKEMGAVIGETMGRPAFMPAPAFAMRTALGEMATILLEGQRVVPQRLLDEGFTFNYPDLHSAVAQLVGVSAAQDEHILPEAA